MGTSPWQPFLRMSGNATPALPLIPKTAAKETTYFDDIKKCQQKIMNLTRATILFAYSAKQRETSKEKKETFTAHLHSQPFMLHAMHKQNLK